MKKAGAKTRLRPATFDDYPQIAALQGRFGLDAGNFDQWANLWASNPLYRSLRKDWEIGWVVEDASGRIAGTLSNLPLSYEWAGRKIVAASGRALVIEPEHRGCAMLLLDRLIHQPGVDLYLNNTVSSAASSSFDAFECQRVPVGLWDRAAFWITSPRQFFQNCLRQKAAAWAKPLSYPLGTASCLLDRWARMKWREGDLEVKQPNGFDDRFDQFWEELRQRNPGVLLAVRTRAVLEWHFRRALRSCELWIATVEDAGRLAAYAIFERKDNSTFDLSRIRLVDFQSLHGPALLLPMLSWALKRCASEGIHMLEIVGRWLEKGELVNTIAPHRRSLSNWTYFYRANNAELAERLADRNAWAPSLFDGDASL